MTADTKAQGDLAELPERAMRAAPVGQEQWPFPKVDYYTADQMREYGRACVAALRSPGTQEGEPSDERAAFEAWFEERRLRTWREAGCDKDRGPIPSAAWAAGSRPTMWEGWSARATLAQALKERPQGDAARAGGEGSC